MKASIRALGLFTALAASGCGDGGPESPGAPAALDRDLAVGATGEDVRDVHQYLTRFGYFPNEQLSRDYPGWRPIVSSVPAAAHVYDERMAAAVREYQARMALPETGIVDRDTRAMLRTPRCGVPDGIAPFDDSNKFSLGGGKWNKQVRVLVYRLNSTASADIDQASAQAAVDAAFDSWEAQTSWAFHAWVAPRPGETTPPPDIEISFAFIDGPPSPAQPNQINTLGFAFGPSAGGDITVDNGDTWAPNVPGGQDLQTLLQHEIGHALGLQHSGFMTASMFPLIAGPDQTLSVDDNVGISALYDRYQVISGNGSARDIAVGANGEVWVIGTASNGPNGFKIHKWAGGTNFITSEGAATRIAVGPNGIPWVVDSQGSIWRRQTSDPLTGSWDLISGIGSARDIGIGNDGSVWIIGTAAFGDGWRVHRFDGTLTANCASPGVPPCSFTFANFGAASIAVAPNGLPWVRTTQNMIFRHTTTDPGTGSWPRLGDGIGVDVGAGEGNTGWVVTPNAGSVNLAVWNEQPRALVGNPPVQGAQEHKHWQVAAQTGAGGNNLAVSVGPNGQPWIVDNNGAIITSVK